MNWKEQFDEEIGGFNDEETIKKFITRIIEKLIADIPEAQWKESNLTWQSTSDLKQQLKSKWL